MILDLDTSEIEKIAGPLVAEAVKRVREEKVTKMPGYDGQYGIIKIFSDEERQALGSKIKVNQAALF